MSDYSRTPSFYNTDEVFKKFLGYTSYYLSLQDNISKIVGLTKPKEILELGSGTGATSNRIANEYPFCQITAVDMRDEMVQLGQKNALKLGLHNIQYVKAEMADYVHKMDALPELVIFLYAFHHIEDPIEKKIEFLKDCQSKMPIGGLLCIADIFLPDACDKVARERLIRTFYSYRIQEAYASTFWASLEGLSKSDIEKSQEIGEYSKENEWKAGNLAFLRDNEYMISLDELKSILEAVDLKIILAEPCNSLNDYMVILSK